MSGLPVTDDVPVMVETSSPISMSVDKDPKEDEKDDILNFSDIAVAPRAGDASGDATALRGGCCNPIDLAIQVITSSRRSKSSPSSRGASFAGWDGGALARGICGVLRMLRAYGLKFSVLEPIRSPAWTIFLDE
jgi:hypothetical protein